MSQPLVEVGQVFYGVLAKLVRDHDGNRRRVMSLPDQVVPAGLYVECSKPVRESSPLGTVFKVNVRVTAKPGKGLYLCALKKAELLTAPEWASIYGGRSIEECR
jgi:hypothetical protein